MELIAEGIALWRNAFEIEDGFAEDYFGYRFEQERNISWRGAKEVHDGKLRWYENAHAPLRVANFTHNEKDEAIIDDNKYGEYTLYLHKVLMKGLAEYLKKYPLLQRDIHYIEAYRLIYYQSGNYMSLHTDQSYAGDHSFNNGSLPHQSREEGGRPEPADGLENINMLRTICCIQHLSDSSDGEDAEWGEFDGGEVSWPYATDKTFTPQKGDMLIYPANFLYAHEVDRILSGHRISNLNCISHGKIPKGTGTSARPVGPTGYMYLDFADGKVDWKGWLK